MINIEYFDKGKSETMVLVHGFTQNRKIFDKQVEFFKKDYNLVLVDLRGHGFSENMDGPYGIEEYADDLEDVFCQLSLKHVIYWGTHTGSALGLNLYLRNKNYISLMILEGMVIPGFDTHDINENINRAREKIEDFGLEEALDDWLMNSQWFQYMRDNPGKCRYFGHKKIIEEFTGKPWLSDNTPKNPDNILSRLDQIELPVLVYNGKYDLEEFFKMTEILVDKKNVTIRVIDEAGGFPLWENPAVVNSTVSLWLQERNK